MLISGLGVIESGSYAVFVSDAGRGGGAYTVAYGQGSTYIDDLRGAIPPDVAVVSGGTAGIRERWTLALNAGDDVAIEAPGARRAGRRAAEGAPSRKRSTHSSSTPRKLAAIAS